ncbi:uncharacterized protein LOC134205118 [Armigeres subalbatus]|uniref:uncharacterized protein LOC134205118 n=1 Tax=Armigeres subalbatus TaxID=124917 RepID=UPI002ED5085E
MDAILQQVNALKLRFDRRESVRRQVFDQQRQQPSGGSSNLQQGQMPEATIARGPPAVIMCWNCDEEGHRFMDCAVLLPLWTEGILATKLSDVPSTFGKCDSGEPITEGAESSHQVNDPSTIPDTLEISSLIINLDNDNRPHAVVEVLGRQITGLLDSGANCSILGGDHTKLAQELGLQKTVLEGGIRTADGTEHRIQSYTRLPVAYNNKNEVVTMLKPKFTIAALVQEFCEQPAIRATNLVSLRKLVSTSDEVIRQLSALGPSCETRDPWLNYIVIKKLDETLRAQWAQHIVDNDEPTFDDMLKFLKRKCEALETCAAFGGRLPECKKEVQRDDRKPYAIKKEIKAFGAVQQLCPVCDKTQDCIVFKESSVNERREQVQQAKLCYNCLRPNHCVKYCSSKSVCRTPNCKQRHHTMLCKGTISQSETEVQSPQEITAAVEFNPAVLCSTNVKNISSSVVIGLLPTALVRVKRNDDQYQEVRVMIDSGSQASLITEHCVANLGLHRSNANLIVTGIASCSSETTRGVVDLQISSRFRYDMLLNVKGYVLSKFPRITPNQQLDPERLKYLDSLQLADPDFGKPVRIDIILGADVFLAILEDGKIRDDSGLPVAINSSFGWIVAGQVFESNEGNCNTAIVSLSMDMDIDKVLRKFWEVEEISKPKLLTQDEQQAVNIFDTTHHRDDTGRFTVRLPFDESKPTLGKSLPAAIQRLKAMERKFARDPDFKRMYGEFMAEYLDLGHMERIRDDEVNVSPEKSFYLPHHGIMRQDSVTTKLRVVFDGSCQSSAGISLNEKLLTGPKVTEDLPIILTRFRSYAFAFMADAEKANMDTS